MSTTSELEAMRDRVVPADDRVVGLLETAIPTVMSLCACADDAVRGLPESAAGVPLRRLGLSWSQCAETDAALGAFRQRGPGAPWTLNPNEDDSELWYLRHVTRAGTRMVELVEELAARQSWALPQRFVAARRIVHNLEAAIAQNWGA